MKSLGVKVGLLVALTILAGWLRLAHLGSVNLYNDEYYQFETAVGWLKLDQWVRYDYYNEGVGKPYDRAKLFILQVAASIKVFGETEAAGRLPAALWGTLLVPLSVILLLAVVRHPWIAYSTGLALALDDFSIGLSRYVRMYSMLMVLMLCLAFFAYLCLEQTGWKRRLSYGLAGGGTLLLGLLIFKEMTLAIVAAIGVYAFCRTVAFIVTRHHSDRPWLWLWIVGTIFAALAITLTLLGYNIVPLDAVIIRTSPHWSYLSELFSNWRIPILAVGFAVIGLLLALKQLRSFVGFAAVLGIVVVSYFTFFSHRWDAQRYLSIVTPLVTLITVVGFIATLKFLFALLPPIQWLRYSLLIPLAFLAGPWLSVPGLSGNDLTHRTALADRSATDIGYADMRTAYAYVAERVGPGEVVLMQGPRFYYWPDNSIPVHLLGGYKNLSLEEFKALAKRGTSGGWVIYNATHQRHLRDNVKEYIVNHFEHIQELDDTQVLVYHFTAK